MRSSAIRPGQNGVWGIRVLGFMNKRNYASGAAGAAAAAAPAALRATFLAAGHCFGARMALWLLTLDDAAPATGTSVLVAKAEDWRKKLTSGLDAAGDAAAAPPDPAVGSSVASPGSPPPACASNRLEMASVLCQCHPAVSCALTASTPAPLWLSCNVKSVHCHPAPRCWPKQGRYNRPRLASSPYFCLKITQPFAFTGKPRTDARALCPPMATVRLKGTAIIVSPGAKSRAASVPRSPAALTAPTSTTAYHTKLSYVK